MASRLTALRRFARGRGFDVALSHASHELPLVARSLGIPSSYAFDYEFALAQHRFGCHSGDARRGARRDPAGTAHAARRPRAEGRLATPG